MTTSTRGAVEVSLHGLNVAVESDLPAFRSYVAAAMEPFCTAPTGAPRVVSRLEWVEGAPPRSLEQSFGVGAWEHRPDRDLYIAGTTAYWLRIDDFEALELAATWQHDCLRLHGRYYFRIGRSHALEPLRRLRHRGRLDQLRGRRFSTLLYYLVYHPLLWLLSREQDWHLMHGGAVARDGRAVVFTGMPGCGKSTLAVSTLADEHVLMLSDNLLLFGEESVRACPELLLLDQPSMARVGSAASRLTATGERRVYARDAYRPDATLLDAVSPVAVFCVERAKLTDCREIDAETCAHLILAGNRMAKEVRRALLMADVLDRIADRRPPDHRSALARLLARTRCFALGIGEGESLGDVSRQVMDTAFTNGSGRARLRA